MRSVGGLNVFASACGKGRYAINNFKVHERFPANGCRFLYADDSRYFSYSPLTTLSRPKKVDTFTVMIYLRSSAQLICVNLREITTEL
jgi:hypothetical protein